MLGHLALLAHLAIAEKVFGKVEVSLASRNSQVVANKLPTMLMWELCLQLLTEPSRVPIQTLLIADHLFRDFKQQNRQQDGRRQLSSFCNPVSICHYLLRRWSG